MLTENLAMDPLPYYIKPATILDKSFVNYALHELIKELRGVKDIAPIEGFDSVYDFIVSNEEIGKIYIAYDEKHTPIGYISVSFHAALHCGGRVAIIEELWVKHDYRTSWAGMSLIKEVEKCASAKQINRIEVGLAHYTYANYEKLYIFYKNMGYQDIGPRCKKILN